MITNISDHKDTSFLSIEKALSNKIKFSLLKNAVFICAHLLQPERPAYSGSNQRSLHRERQESIHQVTTKRRKEIVMKKTYQQPHVAVTKTELRQ